MYKILLASSIGTIVYFLIGFLVFELILGQYMSENSTQIIGFKKTPEESSMLMLIVSCAAYALLLALILGKWSQVTSIQDGMLIGATVGMLVAVMTNSYWYSTSHLFNGLQPLIVDVLAAGLTVGIMGGAIAWALNYFTFQE